MFSMLSATVVERLVHELKVVKFKADENIITMGDLGCDTSLLPSPRFLIFPLRKIGYFSPICSQNYGEI